MKSLKERVAAAQGKVDCDLVLKNATYLDVFSLKWLKGDLAIFDGVLVGIEPGLNAKKTFDASGKFVVPGFIDAHVHVESSMMLPSYFEKSVLAKGTTSAVCDPHELANVLGVSGIQYFLDAASKMKLDLHVMLSSCVPATHLETNGGGTIAAQALLKLRDHPSALGLAEVMNMPGVINGADDVLEKVESFLGRPIDGHAPMLRGRDLTTYASTGISSCHESSSYEEALEKLQKGIRVWIREGSVAKDLDALAPLLTAESSAYLGFCTDDRNPLDIAREGHVDYLVRGAIRKGIAPELAFRAASYSVASHYGLHQGSKRVGAIAPGFDADWIVLDDPKSVAIHSVLKKGEWVSDLQYEKDSASHALGKTVRATSPIEQDLKAIKGNVHVIGVLEGKIVTTHEVKTHDSKGVQKLSVLERYGNGMKPANAYAQGFGENLNGAIASSVGHDSHNLIAVANNEKDMSVAMARLIETGGGFAVAQNGSILADLPLPFGGLMSEKTPEELTKNLEDLKLASKQINCELNEPFLQLAFLSLPVIPSLKLTDQGLVDVEKFSLIDVRAS